MRCSAIGLILLAACGSGSGGSDDAVDPVTADDLNQFQSAISRAARVSFSTDFADIPTTGTIDYRGGTSLQWQAAASSSFTVEGIRGLTRLEADFDTGTFEGEVYEIIGYEGLAADSEAFDGTLTIAGATLPDEVDYVVGTGARDPLNLTGGTMTGTLIGPDGETLEFAAEFDADIRGEDAEYFYGVFESGGGTVTVDGDARDVFSGAIAVTTNPVSPP